MGKDDTITYLIGMRKVHLRYLPIVFYMVTAILLFHGNSSYAQQLPLSTLNESVSAGGFFSPSGSGISATMPSKDGAILHEVRIIADLEDVLTGKESTPGVRGQYLLSYVVSEAVTKKGYVLRGVAGPGVMGGYVKDRGKEFGAVFGLCGMVGMDLLLEKNITVSFSITTELGAHVDYRNRYNSTLTLYRNGLLNTIYPALSVKYRFK